MNRLSRRAQPIAGLAFGLLLASTLPLAAQGPDRNPSVQESFGEAIDVSVVNLDVFVTDRKGQPVTGLRKEDFEIREDGKPVEISNFYAESRGTAAASASAAVQAAAERPVAQRLRLVVFVDDVNLTASNRSRILQSVGRFLHSELKPGDEVMLVRYDQRLSIRRQFTADLGLLDSDLEEILKLPTDVRKYEASFNQAVQKISFSRLGGGDAAGPVVEAGIMSWAGEESIMAQGSLNALDSVVSWLAGVPGRKAVLYVSNGLPLVPGLDLYTIYSRAAQSGDASKRISGMNAQKFDLTTRFRQLTSHASRNRVAFYPIEAFGTRQTEGSLFDSTSLANRQDGLRFLAGDTGGRALLNAADVPGGARQGFRGSRDLLLDRLSAPAAGRRGGAQDQVRVKTKGAQMRYRQWYRDKPVGEAVAEGTLAVMRFGPEDNPLERRWRSSRASSRGRCWCGSRSRSPSSICSRRMAAARGGSVSTSWRAARGDDARPPDQAGDGGDPRGRSRGRT